MLPASMIDLSGLLSHIEPGLLLSPVFHLPDNHEEWVTLLLRWFHIVAGIVWIGHLYFFNLVNVNFMKSLDGPTKGKVIPQLMPRALWWFRWGAVITVLVGLAYYAMYILKGDSHNAGKNVWVVLIVWLLILVVAFALEFFAVRKIDNGWALAVVVALLMILMSLAVICWLQNQLGEWGGTKSYSIGLGGGLGIIMMLNVWGIIWPNQKRIISWTADHAENGTAVPPESAKLARVAFLASRTNTWLSLPMLLLMSASSHFTGWIGA
ncbi:MAG: urate hydroxylase PuuD [Acidobacteriota bacterium]